ncbi:MAG TPA: peptidase MA family metallohydrolase, partial [Candidatus Limnocylindrales bacterium]|nr:peptidase MA family metallohydrolase [Candidatus Limnocylindrales bacterium]
FPDALGPQVADVPLPSSGGGRLRFRWDLAEDGHLVPNTTLEARWRVTPVDGEPVLSGVTRIRYADTRFDWRTIEGDVVRVHWYEGGEAFGRRALEIGDRAVADTAALLGVTEDEPIDFFIYPDEPAFRDALGPGTRENVGGQAHADIRTLFALISPGDIDAGWVGIVVPHELVHLVFDTAVDNPYRFPPRWLNEGLAVYLSQGYDVSDRARVEDAAADGSLMPLAGLTGQFPTTFDRFALAYAESVSAVEHLVRTHGEDALIGLVRSYRDGITDNEAFTRAIGMDVAAFQAAWLAELGAAEPVRYGPQPAPAGPVPSGWEGAPATPLPGSLPTDGGSPPPGAVTARPGTPSGSPGAGDPPTADLTPAVLGGLGVVVLVGAAVIAITRRRPGPGDPA